MEGGFRGEQLNHLVSSTYAAHQESLLCAELRHEMLCESGTYLHIMSATQRVSG